MKAAIRKRYVPPEKLEVGEIKKPSPNDNEISVKIYATTVNRTDCAILTGKPYIMRLFTGLLKPKLISPGTDFAGIIESVGAKVKDYKPKDKVWGFCDNGIATQAEYAAINIKKPISIMPANTSFEQAAASLEGCHYAYNFLKKIKIEDGQKILLNGATGAIGSALLQFLKNKNIYITAVCNTNNIQLIKSLGADRIYDYTKEDFTTDLERYDYVLDAVGKSSFPKCKHLLKPKGKYLSSELGPYAQNIFYALLTPIFSKKKVVFPVPSNILHSINFMKEQLEKQLFQPVIDRVYYLNEISEAYKYVASGQKTGNVVIKINDEQT